jgi:hypothetical protein
MTRPMNYVDPPDVPEGMTLQEYRARGCEPRDARSRPGTIRRLLRLSRQRAAEPRVATPRA